jgi:anti-sigma factor RsiW
VSSVLDDARHLSDAQLLEHADGELSPSADQAVARHLEACWTCRARYEEFEKVIRVVAKFRNDVLLPSAPEPPRGWPGLEPALSARDLPPAGASVIAWLRRPFRRSARLRPLAWAMGAAFGAAALAIALGGLHPSRRAVSPEALLQQAGDAERALVDAPTKVLRRVVQLEERRGSDPSVVGRRRIEIWWRGAAAETDRQRPASPPDTAVMVRRVFDDRERLIAGEWTNANGTRIVYRPGQPPETLPASARPRLDAGDIWRLDPSARDFLALVGRSSYTTVEYRPDGFVVRYRPRGVAGAVGPTLVEARLTIRKDGLTVTDQVLVVLEANTVREYRFAERAREQLPAARVHPAVFVPEPQLAGEPSSPRLASPVKAARPRPTRLTDGALDAMEMAAWQRLHQARLCSSERATVARGADGILVRVAVESETRRDAIRHLLDGFGLPSAIHVDLTVDADAAPRLPPVAPPGRSPGHALLRAYLAGQVARWSGSDQPQKPPVEDAALDAAARQMAAWTVERSSKVLAQARALHNEAGRRPAGKPNRADLDAISAWLSMITDHAREIREEVELLRTQFGPVLFPSGPPQEPREDVDIQDVAHVEAAAERLLDLANSQHRAVQAAFAPAAPDLVEPEPLDGEALWRMWRSLEKQAQKFTAPWVLLRPRATSKE